MSKIPKDINDDEIRIISTNNSYSRNLGDMQPRKHTAAVIVSVLVAVAIAAGLLYMVFGDHGEKLELETEEAVTSDGSAEAAIAADTLAIPALAPELVAAGYVAITDTVAGNVPLTLFTPVNAVPTLHVGNDILSDSTIVFLLQAADVRSDNGGIVGAFVDNGELLSKGQAKSGFCAIIGGKITVGVADSTPLLEQALETDGYFFRQYPLVVAGHIVENKLRTSSLRRALAELDGTVTVVMSRRVMTLHDFSQALVDLGVTNAIYLVGGHGYGFAVDADGRRVNFGTRQQFLRPNNNYILWR